MATRKYQMQCLCYQSSINSRFFFFCCPTVPACIAFISANTATVALDCLHFSCHSLGIFSWSIANRIGRFSLIEGCWRLDLVVRMLYKSFMLDGHRPANHAHVQHFSSWLYSRQKHCLWQSKHTVWTRLSTLPCPFYRQWASVVFLFSLSSRATTPNILKLSSVPYWITIHKVKMEILNSLHKTLASSFL